MVLVPGLQTVTVNILHAGFHLVGGGVELLSQLPPPINAQLSPKNTDIIIETVHTRVIQLIIYM